ncbi:MAG: hypothetical protein NTZ16_00320 [Verrucomicrobia bacterium]|nr:hypothetical protein [Verrucomicrobiota bacterium]
MKTILLSAGIFTLLTTTGCLVSEGGWHGHGRGHGRFESRSEVIVGAPAVVVRVPVVEVRPPAIIVH